MKKLIAVAVLVCACLAPEAFAQSAPAGGLKIVSFTDEVQGLIDNYYKPAHRGVTIDYSHTPYDQFEGWLDSVLTSGKGVPDIFPLESSFVRKYVESGKLLDLTDIYERNKNALLSYPVEVGTHNGRVYAMSWQACPGAMFYRRSLAKKYLGTDDPKVVQTYFSDFNKFIETAKLLRDKSNGQCVVVASRGDLYRVFLGARKTPWVVNGSLKIDPVMEKYMEISKMIYDNRYDARVSQWSDGWFSGMKDEFYDESRRRYEAFAYFLPTWGLHYVLKTNAEDTAGDWAMIQGPAPYYWGGTWFGAWKSTDKPNEVKQMIEYLTCNQDFLRRYVLDSGDMSANTASQNSIKDNFSESFLAGQNHYAAFAEMAKAVNGKLIQATDAAIETIFADEVTAYIEGEKTKAQALADFKRQAENVIRRN